jgi:hypothetical protein
MWHDEPVTEEEALKELDEAVADLRLQDKRLLRVAAALYASTKLGVPQKDLVEMTGYNREQIRRHVEDEKIRRGEIPPTPRYLRNQERAAKARASRKD